MDRVDLVVRDAELVATMDGARRELAGGWVAVTDGFVAALGGPADPVPEADRVISAAHCLVTPGLVNTHHHMFQNLTRAYGPMTSAPLFGWLQTLYPKWRHIDEEAAYLSAWVGLAELALGGCTTSTDHLYLHPRGAGDLLTATITAAGELGMRFHPTHGSMSLSEKDGGLPPDDVVMDDDDILAESVRLVGLHHDRAPGAMTRIALAPCSPFSVSPELMVRTAELAERLDVRLHTHLAENAEDDEYSLQRFGRRPVDYLEDVGWLGSRAWVAHCVMPNDEEVVRLGQASVGVAHCPSSNLILSSGIAPITAMRAAGVPVGIGCDGSSSADAASLWQETRLALLLSKLAGGADAITARDALELATRGGAACLGRTGELGELSVGSVADLVAWRLDGVAYAGAVSDPVEALLRCGPASAHHTIVAGRPVVEDGRLVSDQVTDRLARHRLVAQRIHAARTSGADAVPGVLLSRDAMDAFEQTLDAVLRRKVAGVDRLLSAERLSGGASQETYRLTVEVDGEPRPLAMRRAAGGETGVAVEGRPGLAVEAMLMQVARAAGVPEPEVYTVLEPEDGLGDGFIMEWLDGEALGARIVRSPELDGIRPHLAFQCGQVLARIHAIDPVATGLAPHLDTLDPEAFVLRMWTQYRELGTPQPMIDYSARWLLDHLPPPSQPRLVHNDFRNGNVMVGPDGVMAVLDWEVAHLGDPMRDLGWICTNSWRFGRRDLPVGGFGRYEDLFAGYESVTGRPVDPDHVKFWEVFGSYWWAIGCLKMGDHYRHGPDATVERPGIARRSSECQVDCVNLLIPGPVELVTATPAPTSTDLPGVDELVESVRDFLRGDVMAATQGRTSFMARVASNSLDIVLRELTLGPAQRAGELARLRDLVGDVAGGTAGQGEELLARRWALCERLYDGAVALDRADVQHHLRTTVVNQVGIDQPTYSGYLAAIA